MKKNFVVVKTLAALCATVCGLAVAQDLTLPAVGIYPADNLRPLEQTETAEMRKRENKLNRESQRLVREYSRTEDASKRRELEETLQQTVDDHFSIKQELRAKELADLEAKIQKLRSRHERRNDSRARIVQDRVQQLLREAEGLGWGSGSRGPAGWPAAGLIGPPVQPMQPYFVAPADQPPPAEGVAPAPAAAPSLPARPSRR